MLKRSESSLDNLITVVNEVNNYEKQIDEQVSLYNELLDNYKLLYNRIKILEQPSSGFVLKPMCIYCHMITNTSMCANLNCPRYY